MLLGESGHLSRFEAVSGECQECVCFLVENLNQTQIAVLCLFTIAATFHRLSAGVDHYYVLFLLYYL